MTTEPSTNLPEEFEELEPRSSLALAIIGPAFTLLAREFRRSYPAHEAWSIVEWLGAQLQPGEALYAEAARADHEH